MRYLNAQKRRYHHTVYTRTVEYRWSDIFCLILEIVTLLHILKDKALDQI